MSKESSKDMINYDCDVAKVRLSGLRQKGDEPPEPFVVERSQKRDKRSETRGSLLFTLGSTISESTSREKSETAVDKILQQYLPIEREHLCFGQHLSEELIDKTSKLFKKQMDPLVPQAVWTKAKALAKTEREAADESLRQVQVERLKQEAALPHLSTEVSKLAAEVSEWQRKQPSRIAHEEMQQRDAERARDQAQTNLASVATSADDVATAKAVLEYAKTAAVQCKEANDTSLNQLLEISDDVTPQMHRAEAATAQVNTAKTERDAFQRNASAELQQQASHDERACADWPSKRQEAAKVRVAEADAGALDLISHKRVVDEALVTRCAAYKLLKDMSETNEGECSHCGSRVDQAHLLKTKHEREEAVRVADAEVERLQCEMDARCWQLSLVMGGKHAAKEAELNSVIEAAEESQRNATAELSTARDAAKAAKAAKKESFQMQTKRLEMLNGKRKQAEQAFEKAEQSARERTSLLETASAAGQRVEEACKIVSQLKAEVCGKEQELQDVTNKKDALEKQQQLTKETEAGWAKRTKLLKSLCDGTTAHFGSSGVLVMLYVDAVKEIETRTNALIERNRLFVEGERVELKLSFKEIKDTAGAESGITKGEVEKTLRVVNGDSGSERQRLLTRLCGGEWRRLDLALSLAFCEVAKERLNISCNVLVLDQPMQQLDENGKRAVMSMMRTLPSEVGEARCVGTVLFIEHNLSEELRDGLTVDVVKRTVKSAAGDGSPSKIHLHNSLLCLKGMATRRTAPPMRRARSAPERSTSST